MKYLLILLLALSTFSMQAQDTFKVADFSDHYYGKVYIEDTSEVFSKGWVAIYDKKNNKELIKVEAEELAADIHEGKVAANVLQLPYGEQSVIIYEDFNFDGKEDFAIEDGQNSCYHGPSFQIYLAGGQSFEYNEAFTQLAQENCGMFSTDPESKTISTMTKSGCCWHQFSEYKVVNNVPKPVHTVTEDAMHIPYVITTEETREGAKTITTTTTNLDLESTNATLLFAFLVPKNHKRVLLFNDNGLLNYALMDADSSIGFYYPTGLKEDEHFTCNKDKGTLSFQNKDATYTIYETATACGIRVHIKGKDYDWAGGKSTQKGSLAKLMNEQYDNLTNP
jgi:hypothetical protein